MKLPSYGSIYNLGHRAIDDIFNSPVTIEEKIDGSQFTFGLVKGEDEEWEEEICFRSKGSDIYIDDQDNCASAKMFQYAVNTALRLSRTGLLHPGWVYYGEYLCKNKHNTLAYDRVPLHNIIIFDIDTGDQQFLTYTEKQVEAARLGLECVPLIFEGQVQDFETFKKFLDTVSVLGGSKIEGMVIKNYTQFTRDKKVMRGKFVSEAFKETHRETFKADGNKQEIIQQLINSLRTNARWLKAIQHLKERNELLNAPQDIGNLLREVSDDVEKEEKEFIKDALYSHFRKNILRGVTAGLPQWYKELLAAACFNGGSIEGMDDVKDND